MTIILNETELRTLETKKAQAHNGQIGYWEIYKWLADTLEAKGTGSWGQVLLFA